jgi:ABC-type phosphate/phosphonate transport system substrate-binding protein
MYDFAEVGAAHDAFVAALARRLGIDVTRSRAGAASEHWGDPDLLLSQTCGYPLMFGFAGRLRVVATPSYRAPGCGEGMYASAIVVRADASSSELADLRGGICAMNDRSSHSGMNALRGMIAPLAGDKPFFRSVRVTGSHAESLACVQRGEADVAAIDAVTHALLAKHRPSAVAGTRILTMSPRAPALPYVTRAGGPVDALREALVALARDPALAGVREALLIDDVVVLPDHAYEAIREVENDAVALGYSELR